MNFVEVSCIPKQCSHVPSCGKKNLVAHLDAFMDMGVKYARVELNRQDYSNIKSAFDSIKKACIRHAYPIKVYGREGCLYLERTDLPDKPKRNRSRKKVTK